MPVGEKKAIQRALRKAIRGTGHTIRNDNRLPGRNTKCPCGSGKKFKICCLQRVNQAVQLVKGPAPDAH